MKFLKKNQKFDREYYTINLDDKQKVLRGLYNLMLSYANIYALYMERQLKRLGKHDKVESPTEWLKDFDSLQVFLYLCADNITPDQLSRSILVDILTCGYETLMWKIKQINEDKPWKNNRIHEYLYNYKIWNLYSLWQPYIPIRSSFDIGRQVTLRGKFKVPKFGMVNADRSDVYEMPLNLMPISGRLYLSMTEDRKYEGFVRLSCARFEQDDGFVKLKRR